MKVSEWFRANPRTEWALIVGGVAVWVGIFDLMRHQGSPDGDTLTEVIRDVLYLETTGGRALLLTSLGLASASFYRHLTKPDMLELLRQSRIA